MEYNQPASSGIASKVIGVIVGIAIIGAIIAWRSGRNPDLSADATPSPSSDVAASTPTVTVETKNKYTDGTYSVTGNYVSPDGPQTVGVTLTLIDDAVANATFQIQAVAPTSKRMQTNFSQGFSAEVVGKPIDAIALTVVNGSSLTPKGFMDALAKIKSQAL